jgi:hypothetical protein
MFDELCASMEAAGWSGVDEVRNWLQEERRKQRAKEEIVCEAMTCDTYGRVFIFVFFFVLGALCETLNVLRRSPV